MMKMYHKKTRNNKLKLCDYVAMFETDIKVIVTQL